jgi:hypothetical protein
MQYTFSGSTGRAQLIVREEEVIKGRIMKRLETPEYLVKLLPRSANRNTAFSSAGEPAYRGSELEKALMHIRAWTGLELTKLPQALEQLRSRPAETVHEEALAS